ncbi:hypothetical protein GGF32_004061 [Allomyces javanicus]|nr:hypothetical protein GGF32_004061 [Allomyces javanicus]
MFPGHASAAGVPPDALAVPMHAPPPAPSTGTPSTPSLPHFEPPAPWPAATPASALVQLLGDLSRANAELMTQAAKVNTLVANVQQHLVLAAVMPPTAHLMPL